MDPLNDLLESAITVNNIEGHHRYSDGITSIEKIDLLYYHKVIQS
jgi:hypothetical protein